MFIHLVSVGTGICRLHTLRPRGCAPKAADPVSLRFVHFLDWVLLLISFFAAQRQLSHVHVRRHVGARKQENPCGSVPNVRYCLNFCL